MLSNMHFDNPQPVVNTASQCTEVVIKTESQQPTYRILTATSRKNENSVSSNFVANTQKGGSCTSSMLEMQKKSVDTTKIPNEASNSNDPSRMNCIIIDDTGCQWGKASDARNYIKHYETDLIRDVSVGVPYGVHDVYSSNHSDGNAKLIAYQSHSSSMDQNMDSRPATNVSSTMAYVELPNERMNNWMENEYADIFIKQMQQRSRYGAEGEVPPWMSVVTRVEQAKHTTEVVSNESNIGANIVDSNAAEANEFVEDVKQDAPLQSPKHHQSFCEKSESSYSVERDNKNDKEPDNRTDNRTNGDLINLLQSLVATQQATMQVSHYSSQTYS
jgi:hypothetical protein